MYLKTLYILIFIVITTSCNHSEKITSQDNLVDYNSLKRVRNLNIDSIYRVSALRKDDTTKVLQLITAYRLSIRNTPIRPDILAYALKLSKNLKYNTGMALCLNYKGLYHRYNHEYLKSVKYHKEAVEYFEKSWDRLSRIKNLNSLGVSYRRMNIEEEAIKCYFEALRLSEKENHTNSMAIALNGIGNSYINLERYDDAIRYFKLALRLEKANKNKRGIGYDYSNIGEVYMYKEMYDSSYAYHMRSLKIAKEIDYKDNVAIVYNTIGQMFQHKKEFKNAIEYFEKAIPILKKYHGQRYLCNTYINLGISETEVSDFANGKENITKGLELANKLSSKENIVLAHNALSKLYEKTKSYELALKEHQIMAAYRDSIINLKSENSIKALEINYESQKKDLQIQRLNLNSKVQKSKIVIQFMAIAILIALAIAIYIFNRLRIRNKDLELKDMRYKIEEYLTQISYFESSRSNDGPLVFKEEYGLSSREQEVLTYIAKGLKNQEIADKMFVSLSTIKTHTKNIFDKLDVRNRIEAANKVKNI